MTNKKNLILIILLIISFLGIILSLFNLNSYKKNRQKYEEMQAHAGDKITVTQSMGIITMIDTKNNYIYFNPDSEDDICIDCKASDININDYKPDERLNVIILHPSDVAISSRYKQMVYALVDNHISNISDDQKGQIVSIDLDKKAIGIATLSGKLITIDAGTSDVEINDYSIGDRIRITYDGKNPRIYLQKKESS